MKKCDHTKYKMCLIDGCEKGAANKGTCKDCGFTLRKSKCLGHDINKETSQGYKKTLREEVDYSRFWSGIYIFRKLSSPT